jgi:hypothetical protein
MTSKSDIREWLNRGKERGATHVIVFYDDFDGSDFPSFVMPGESPKVRIQRTECRAMEVYDLSINVEAQLNEHRAMNF